VLTTILVSALYAVILFPMPVSTVGAGVVWLPEQSQVRTSNDAQITQILVDDGQQVSKGQALVVLDEPSLLIEKRRLMAQIASAESQQADAWQKEAQQGRNATEQLVRLQSDLAQVEAKLNGLILRAEADGRFVLPIKEDLIGRHMSKGTLIAYVLGTEATTVRVAVTQDDIAQIRSGVTSISVHLAEFGNRYFNGQVLRLEPAATRTLPSKAIGDHGGGSLTTDSSDAGGMTTLEPIFLVDVIVPELRNLYMGGRATVRFSYEEMPLADTLLHRMRQAFLKTFSMVSAS
jgi:putative peptide zinc metalloprotease protein